MHAWTGRLLESTGDSKLGGSPLKFKGQDYLRSNQGRWNSPFKPSSAERLWLTPIILATQEAGIRRTAVRSPWAKRDPI
jgi:hypothetical protein